VLSVKGTEGSKSENGHFSAEIQAAVRAELEMMLMAPFFAQSNRCKSFLSYVVLETLSGNASQLKERTIGISVFGRANDYDTGETSIVRVTANEVRKRIGQYYRDSRVVHPIQIELPTGAYVPEFRLRPGPGGRPPERIDDLDSSNGQLAVDPTALPGTEHPSFVLQSDVTPSHPLPIEERPAAGTPRSRKTLVSVALLVLLLVSGLTTYSVWKNRSQKAGPQIWEAFSHSKAPVLICIDTHNLNTARAVTSPDAQKFVDLILLRQIISLDDAAVLSSVAGVLGKKNIPFRVVGAEQTSLTEFRRQPVILIGAIDNKWTLRLTQSMRYRIDVANPPGSGSDKDPVASILDSGHPGSAPWTVDLSTPFVSWKTDYAIVARVDDSTTGVPVLIEAGLGNDGSIAASELITTGALTARLADEPPCRYKSNFEAVIGTDIIDTKPGPPHILRLTCW